jgi:hypothetical protein
LVEGFQYRVPPHSRQGAHVQHGSHHDTTTPGGATASQRPTVAIQRRHPHQGRDLGIRGMIICLLEPVTSLKEIEGSAVFPPR